MANYEIMIIVDPKENLKNVELLSKEVFKDGLKKFTKMERTDLAYPINNSTIANYFLLNVESNGQEVKEFSRKVNISKTIWRHLAINLDTERAIESLKNMKKFEEWKAKKEAEKLNQAKNFDKKLNERVNNE